MPGVRWTWPQWSPGVFAWEIEIASGDLDVEDVAAMEPRRFRLGDHDLEHRDDLTDEAAMEPRRFRLGDPS